ncbi:MAG: hypothetical protein V2A71_04310 [Candidatus Eisenbacteria bacterium]
MGKMPGFFTFKMSKSTYVVIGVLVVVLLAIGGMDQQMKKNRARGRSLSAAPQEMNLVASVPASSQQDVVDTNLEWGADPFGDKFSLPITPSEGEAAPGSEGPESGIVPPASRLQGIARGPGGEIALIDGELMRPGDRVGKMRLMHIGQDYVILAGGGQTVRLALSSPRE